MSGEIYLPCTALDLIKLSNFPFKCIWEKGVSLTTKERGNLSFKQTSADLSINEFA